MLTVYISIGNSDDKLAQGDWASLYAAVDQVIQRAVLRIHGAWTSQTTDPWQNACWCVEIEETGAPWLRDRLANLALAYDQDSIAWAVAPTTEFLTAPPVISPVQHH